MRESTTRTKAPRRWLGYAEAAHYIGVSERRLRRWAPQGRVPYTRLGGRTVFSEERLDEWLEAQSHDPGERGE